MSTRHSVKFLIIIAAFNFISPVHAQSVKTITYKDGSAFKIEGRIIVDITLKIDAPFSTAVLTIQFYDGIVLYSAQQRGQEHRR